jgi:excisionase family DNA binding protein
MTEESPEITYGEWYPDVPAIMDSGQLAELLSTSDQVIRAWAREGVIPAHRPTGGRKFTCIRHEIFTWLVEHRYVSSDENERPINKR